VALMMKALSYLGYFPREVRPIPAQIRVFMAEQLGYAEDLSLQFGGGRRSRVRHWIKIREFVGWRAATTRDKRELHIWLRQEGAILGANRRQTDGPCLSASASTTDRIADGGGTATTGRGCP
jgi:hypothetical protein